MRQKDRKERVTPILDRGSARSGKSDFAEKMALAPAFHGRYPRSEGTGRPFIGNLTAADMTWATVFGGIFFGNDYCRRATRYLRHPNHIHAAGLRCGRDMVKR